MDRPVGEQQVPGLQSFEQGCWPLRLWQYLAQWTLYYVKHGL
jgi:hypothetical protein